MLTNTYDNYIKHLESIIQSYDSAASKHSGGIGEPEAYGIVARSQGAIQKICGSNSPYTFQMQTVLKSLLITTQADRIVGIVRSLKSDLEVGYLHSFPELVRGELFENLIDMAEHLLQEGYKDAAAVIAGTSLESHLRQLSNKHGVSLDHTAPDGSTKHKKAEQLNQDLGKSVYSLFDQKQITAWLDLRNNAAHGQYDKYSSEQVVRLIEWVRDFISKNPA